MVRLTKGTGRDGSGGRSGRQVIEEQVRSEFAAQQARAVAEGLAATAPPHTPHMELPFLPELGRFLAALQQARARHHEATGELARFYQGAAGALDEFRGRVDEHEQAA